MTAVEYLEEKLDNSLWDTDHITWQLVCKAIKEAKLMEREQIISAYDSGCVGEMFELNSTYSAEKYYDEQFKNKL